MFNNTVRRTINFFRIQGWKFDQNNQWQQISLRSSFENINNMSFDLNGRYQSLPTGDGIVMKDISFEGGNIQGKIGTRRLTNLPSEEIGGDELLLELEENACLFEPVHFVLFRTSVLAIEYNHYGPRPSTLKRYLQEKGNSELERVELLPILRHDVANLLRQAGVVTLFEIAIQRDGINQVEELDSDLHSALNAAARTCSRAEQIEIVLRPKPHKRDSINLRFLNRIAQWISRPDNVHICKKLKIKAISDVTSRTAEYDLLSEKIVSKKTVAKENERYKRVDSEAMFRAIHEAYHDMYDEIQQIIRGQ